MTVASGTQARIGAQHAVDVGPDDDLVGVEQRAEDRGREVAAVAAERGLQALRVARDEAGDDERRAARSASCRVGVRARLLPAHARAERRPIPRARRRARRSMHLPGRRPRGVAGSAENRRVDQISPNPAMRSRTSATRSESAGRSAGCRRCRGNPAQVSRENRCAPRLPAACSRSPRWRVRSASSCSASPASCRSAEATRREQCVGDAATGGEHDAQAWMRILLEDPRHALHADRIGDARAAELVYSPPLHVLGSLVVSLSRFPCSPRKRSLPCRGFGTEISRTFGKVRTLGV